MQKMRVGQDERVGVCRTAGHMDRIRMREGSDIAFLVNFLPKIIILLLTSALCMINLSFI